MILSAKAIGKFLHSRIRFDRNEFSGAFGDIGTVLPLVVGIIMVTGIDGSRVFIMFGAMQMTTAVAYGIPIPVQPLKVAAMIVITQKISGNLLFGGGLAIGITMLVLSITGFIDFLGKAIPKSTIRGIQLGLGLQLMILAVTRYVPSGDLHGELLAALAFILMVSLLGNRIIPPAFALIILGAVYYVLFGGGKIIPESIGGPVSGHSMPTIDDIATGFLLFAIPQIPLSLGNSIYATSQLSHDYFSETKITPGKISLTYAFMNIVCPLFGGIPVCHGSGGMAGHHLFGARTGGSVFICGTIFVLFGIVFSNDFSIILHIFPRPVLGIILLFEGMNLACLVRDMSTDVGDMILALIVGAFTLSLPYGYLAGMSFGLFTHHVIYSKHIRIFRKASGA
ncbi:MAG TPA: putative sulfate/molybdate transporter [Spirochaetota bacterium]|nr:putative sulfate/molybdate transporter [Spirochaetota bacterium]HSA15134.1 putative sulfate/molybdate transporter [Spirochaetota bacterium]